MNPWKLDGLGTRSDDASAGIDFVVILSKELCDMIRERGI